MHAFQQNPAASGTPFYEDKTPLPNVEEVAPVLAKALDRAPEKRGTIEDFENEAPGLKGDGSMLDVCLEHILKCEQHLHPCDRWLSLSRARVRSPSLMRAHHVDILLVYVCLSVCTRTDERDDNTAAQIEACQTKADSSDDEVSQLDIGDDNKSTAVAVPSSRASRRAASATKNAESASKKASKENLSALQEEANDDSAPAARKPAAKKTSAMLKAAGEPNLLTSNLALPVSLDLPIFSPQSLLSPTASPRPQSSHLHVPSFHKNSSSFSSSSSVCVVSNGDPLPPPLYAFCLHAQKEPLPRARMRRASCVTLI